MTQQKNAKQSQIVRVNRLKRTYIAAMKLLLTAILVGAFAYTWFSFYNEGLRSPFLDKGNWLIYAIYTVILYGFFRVYGSLKVGYYRVSEVIYALALTLLFVNGITYVQLSLIAQRLISPIPLLIMMLVQMVLAALWALVTNSLYYSLYPPHRMIIVYGRHAAASLVMKMSRRADKYQICEAINVEEGEDKVFERISNYDSVIVCGVDILFRNRLLKYCFEHNIRLYATPSVSDIIIRGGVENDLFDTPLVLCRNGGLSPEQRFVKRLVDIVCSILMLLVAWPFMLLTALAVKLYDHGPVFYKQTRLTIDGKKFQILKFRSMSVDAEKNGAQLSSGANDKRVTPVGRFIRKVRLDELPQILNVLMGDMSIVGPRPERPEIASQYEEHMPEFRLRLRVKAGLTGYAQVIGKYNTTPYDKLKLDLMYISNYSLLKDFTLMLMTVKILFVPESTEGIADGATTAMTAEDNLPQPEESSPDFK